MKFYSSFKVSVKWSDLLVSIKDLLFVSNTKTQSLDFLKEYINKKYIIDVPSSRWGLVFLLKALNFERDSEIIVPAYTYFAVPSAIIRAGLKPVFVDIAENSVNIDEKKIEGNISSKTKAIIATHLCGFPCNLKRINEIAKKYNLVVIEDCAQSFGAKYENRNTGDYSVASYYSLSITKNFTMFAGGILATDDDEIAKLVMKEAEKILPLTKISTLKFIIKAFIMKFATSKVITPFTCLFFLFFSVLKIDIVNLIFKEKNFLLDNEYPKNGRFNYVQKHIAIRQLKDFEKNNLIKEQNGKLFYNLVSKKRNCNIPGILDNCKNIFSSMPIFVENREKVKIELLKKGIDASKPFVQCCPTIKDFGKYDLNKYPNSLRAQNSLLYFISSNEINDKDIEYIVNKF